MEHLPIHLPYEARVGGLVQYRWMYPFERLSNISYLFSINDQSIFIKLMSSIYCIRFIRTLKDKVTNTSAIEGSICEAYLVEETSTFTSYYYSPDVPCRRNIVPRDDDGGEGSSIRPPLSRLGSTLDIPFYPTLEPPSLLSRLTNEAEVPPP